MGMRSLLLVSMLAIATGCARTAPPPAVAVAATCAAAHPGMQSYQMALLYRGPSWTPAPSPLSEGHMAHIQEMAKAGKLALAGPFEQPEDAKNALAGIFVLNVPTRAEAQALVDEDPAVHALRFRVEIVEWYGPKALVCALER